MSRSVSTVAVAILLFLTIIATFASAAPVNIERRHKRNDDYTATDTTDTTDTTDADDSTTNLSGAVDTTSSATHTGQATWYEAGLGACGVYDTDSDFIVALAAPDWNSGSNCGKQLQITNTANGKTCTATVRDLCPDCASGDLDLSPTTFQTLDSNLGDGVFPISWSFI